MKCGGSKTPPYGGTGERGGGSKPPPYKKRKGERNEGFKHQTTYEKQR